MPVKTGATLPLAAGGSVERASEKLALVIPTLHEGGNIPTLLGEVRAKLEPLGVSYEILVVDDDSCDGTAEVVSAISREDSRVRLLVRKGERGLSGAILHGWLHTDATILGVMDADLQHPPGLLPKLLAAILEGRDLVIGSRYAKGGNCGEWNPARKLISSAAVWATWPLQRPRLWARDPMSGFFMVRRQCVQHVEFQRTGFKLLLEILVRGRVQTMKEIPFIFGRRRVGASKANLKVAVDYASLLVRLYRARYGFDRQLRSAPAD